MHARGTCAAGGQSAALCPAWKRGHCTGERWCSKQHPKPSPDNGALAKGGRAAARAALRYGVCAGLDPG